MKHIILYAHGFATDKTDRGLFTDIAKAFPESEHVMFEFDEKNEKGETIAKNFTEREQQLSKIYQNLHKQDPGAIIDLVCHSQGCIIAALANLKGVRKTIFLAPPLNYEDGTKERQKKLKEKRTTELPDGTLSSLRRDGSITLTKPAYWQDYNKIQNIKQRVNELNHFTDLYIVKAENDEILLNESYDGLDPTINIIVIPADHAFTGESRKPLTEIINKIISVAPKS